MMMMIIITVLTIDERGVFRRIRIGKESQSTGIKPAAM
jgi:hypothetical protein